MRSPLKTLDKRLREAEAAPPPPMPPHVTPRQRANLEATIGYRRWAELATGKRTHLTISSGRWQKWCDLQKVRGAVPPLEGPGIPDLDVLILKHEDPD